jgi:hypothetical protein
MSNPFRYITGVVFGAIFASMFFYPPSVYPIIILMLIAIRVAKDLK